MRRIFHNKKGQSLVEIIIALAIFSLVSLTVSAMALNGLSALRSGDDLSRATQLAHEALDATRSIRDQHWLNLVDGTYGLTTTNGFYEFDGASEIIDTFTRTITVESVQRDGSNNIVELGGTIDPRTKRITSTVTWQGALTPRTVSATTYLTDWTVSDWHETTDSEFGAGEFDFTETVDVSTASYLALTESGGFCVGSSESINDNTQGEFDAGTYSATQWDTSYVELSPAGQAAQTGNYTSQIFDAENLAEYQTISWIPSSPYQKPIPNNGGVETAYSSWNLNASDNAFLMHFDEPVASTTFAETSGGANDGSCAGITCPTAGNEGKIASAVLFDGVNDVITTGSDMNTVLGGTASVSYWIRTTQVGNATMWEAPGITGVEQSGGGNDVFWGWIDNTGRIGIQAGDGAAAKSTSPINDNAWHHIFLTRNATTGDVQVYVNGVLNQTVASDPGVKTTPFSGIGMITDTGGTPVYYQGYLDEFAYFPGVKDATFVESLYRRGATRLQVQVRSCDDALCDTEDFVGPDGTAATYYSEATNYSTGLPSFAISNLAENQYFQYETLHTVDNASYNPELRGIEIDYQTICTDAFAQDSGFEKFVSLEAENAQTNTPQGAHAWEEYNDTAGFSGAGFMRALPDSGTLINAGFSATSPRLDFEVEFLTTGTHYIWVRGYATGGADDSVHVGLNGAETSTSDRIDGFTAGNWVWSQNTIDGPVATMVIPTVGTHTINVWMREDGFRFDKLLITTDATYTPTGTGPAESNRAVPKSSIQFVDDSESEFDLGNYAATEWSTDRVTLTAAGKLAQTGTFTSRIFDSGDLTATWENLSWLPNAPYKKELPNGGGTESAYPEGNASMTGNRLLLHANEGSGTLADSSGNGNDGTSSGGLTYGATGIYHSAISFDGVDDLVTVAHDATFNITDAITMEGWFDPAAIAGLTVGDIQPPELNEVEYDTTNGGSPSMIHISGDVYAIAYTGSGSDGFVRTVSIDSAGIVTNSLIDELEFDTSNGLYPDLIHVTGDVYAVAYTGNGNDGWVASFTISATGAISNSTIDDLEFDTGDGLYPDIIAVDADTFAVAYTGGGTDGFLRTFNIDGAGNISNAVISTYEFDTSNGAYPSIINVGPNVFAIAYRGTGNDGFVITVTISNAGAITASAIDALEFDTADCLWPELFHVDGSIYGVAYQGSGGDGFVRTFSISAVGDISNSNIDTLEFDTSDADRPSVTMVASGVFAIAYGGTGGVIDDGFLVTIGIDNAGDIANSLIDSHEFAPGDGISFSILNVTGNVFAIAYEGNGNDGFLQTITIIADGSVKGGIEKSGSYGLLFGETTAYAKINSTEISSATLTAGFNHVALTYNKDAGSNQLKLYVNGVEVVTTTLTDAIATNTNDVILGNFYGGLMDEVAIYARELTPAEITSRYERGVLDMRLQIRTCDDASCSGEFFAGPNGTALDYFDELDNTATGLPDFALTTSANQYFQYEVTFTTLDTSISPDLFAVTVDYSAAVGGGGGYAPLGTFLSQVHDSDSAGTAWSTVYWSEIVPVDTNATVAVRTGNVAIPDGTWSAWSGEMTNPEGNSIATQSGRYIQYRVTLSSNDSLVTPTFEDITVTYR